MREFLCSIRFFYASRAKKLEHKLDFSECVLKMSFIFSIERFERAVSLHGLAAQALPDIGIGAWHLRKKLPRGHAGCAVSECRHLYRSVRGYNCDLAFSAELIHCFLDKTVRRLCFSGVHNLQKRRIPKNGLYTGSPWNKISLIERTTPRQNRWFRRTKL